MQNTPIEARIMHEQHRFWM